MDPRVPPGITQLDLPPVLPQEQMLPELPTVFVPGDHAGLADGHLDQSAGAAGGSWPWPRGAIWVKGRRRRRRAKRACP